MNIFNRKSKVDIIQFVADCIQNGTKFYETNVNKMVTLSDEFNTLDEGDKSKLKDLGYSLIISDIMLGIFSRMKANISAKDTGILVHDVYIKYLREVQNFNEEQVAYRLDTLEKLIRRITDLDDNKEPQFVICQAFAETFAGTNTVDDTIREKQFAAFKMSKAIVKADLVKEMLKNYEILW